MKILPSLILSLCFLFAASNVFAKIEFSPPLTPEITENDVKKIEDNLIKNARLKLKLKGLNLNDRIESLTVLLHIYKKRNDTGSIAGIITGARKLSPDVMKFDGSEERLELGLKLAELYIEAYIVKKEGLFKDRAMTILREIQKRHFDSKHKAFFVNVNRRLIATATANADASITFFKASDEFKEKSLGDIARQGIAYLKNNLIKDGEAFHIFDPDASKVYMDGQLIDNADSGIALLEGYKVFNDNTYLDTAKSIADFLQKRLYDEKLGGFILRSSNSPEIYPQGEELYISVKPFEENAAAGYFFASMYKITGDGNYRDIAKNTIGYLLTLSKDTPSQKQIYFITTVYNYLKSAAIAKKEKGLEKFSWETKLPEAGILSLAVISFLAGVLSFLSPCTLPILPAYFAFTFQGEKSRVMAMTFFFFLGLALVFSIMGATASFIGSFLKTNISIITTVGGILIIIFGFMSFIGKGFSGARIFQKSPSATLGGSFIFGAAMAFGWTACVGPILAGILVLAATKERVLSGVILLFIYALGLGLPLMTISLFFKNMDKNGAFWRFLKGKGWEVNIFNTTFILHSTSMISGVIFISLGILMTSGYLAYINKILPLSTQVWFAGIEDWLLERFK